MTFSQFVIISFVRVFNGNIGSLRRASRSSTATSSKSRNFLFSMFALQTFRTKYPRRSFSSYWRTGPFSGARSSCSRTNSLSDYLQGQECSQLSEWQLGARFANLRRALSQWRKCSFVELTRSLCAFGLLDHCCFVVPSSDTSVRFCGMRPIFMLKGFHTANHLPFVCAHLGPAQRFIPDCR